MCVAQNGADRLSVSGDPEHAAREGISVVIPVHNRPALVGTLESVFAQTLPVDEIIVVDDGSAQPVDKCALEALDPRIRVIVLRENVGGSAARNVGTDAATQEWVAFLDSDDTWLPHKLERQFAAVSGEEDVVLATNTLVVSEHAASRPYNSSPPPPDIPLSEWFLIENGTFQTSTLVMRRSLAQRFRFDSALRRHQDWDLLLRLDAAGVRVQYLDECLVLYDNTQSSGGRVSQGADVRPTRHWYTASGKLLTPKAKYFHYTYQWHFRHGQWKTLSGNILLLRLMLGWPRSFVHLPAQFLREHWRRMMGSAR